MSILAISQLLRSTGNSFDGQQPDETVIVLLRRHPVVIILPIIFGTAMALVPVALAGVFLPTIIAHGFLPLLLFGLSLVLLAYWQAIFYAMTMYTLDVWIVTDKRIIDSTQHGFFNRKVSELSLNRIQDTTVRTLGILPSMFDFGNIEIETAGAKEEFSFRQVPNPAGVKDKIMKAAQDYHAAHPGGGL